MRKLSAVFLIVALALQMPSAVFAQSFRTAESTSVPLNPEAYGLRADYREMPLLRTEQTLTFVKPDGKFVSIGAGADLFTHDEDGRLVPIEESGKQTTDGILFDRLPKDIVVHFDTLRPSYVYQKDNHWFRLSYAGEAKAELESPNVVRYRLADHAVVRFTVKGATVSKAITIDGYVDPSVLQFSLETDPTLSIASAGNGIELDKADGTTVFESSPPTLEDTNRNILDHPIAITSLGSGYFAYKYDPTNLPSVYIIDPSTTVRSPGTAADGGGARPAWINASNVSTSNDVYAATTVSESDPGNISNFLKTTNYGFYVADPNATIDGVVVNIEVHNDNTNDPVLTSNVQLIKYGTLQGEDKAPYAQYWTGTDQVFSFGSSTDLWGLTLTGGTITSTTFGVGIVAACTYISPCSGVGNGEPRVDHITMQVYGTLSAAYITYLQSFPQSWENICKINSLEGIGCWCGYCGSLAVPPGITAVDATNEGIDMTTQGIAGGKLVRFKKGSTRIADVPIMFISSGPSCQTLTIDADVTERQSLLHGIADYITGTNSGYLLYVTKSVSDDQVRVCSGKATLGCSAGDSWSFLANDTGTITETNGGFDASKISVSVADGYWEIFGLQETGGEGEDGGGGGVPVPEFPFLGLLVVSLACIYFIRWNVLRSH
ncbi:MAG: hypothetical protein KBA40_01340 [Candidatus Peribacteraceae bacterium]|nr:hypothetical protein [Candidatus Peribacteraceae bacterium]MBP9850831.1 hypothetical protein [Candidatus Peribacteraceae bacterium]